jgi:exodeoxyribonuclease VII small subunit
MSDGAGLTFEEAYSLLQETVARLESGNLPLEESLALYEHGTRLAALCAGQLERAELRVLEIESALGETLATLDDARPAGDVQDRFWPGS